MIGKSTCLGKFFSIRAPVCFGVADRENQPVQPKGLISRPLTMCLGKPAPPKVEELWWKPYDHYEDVKRLISGSEAYSCLTKSMSTKRIFVVKRFDARRQRYNIYRSASQEDGQPMPNEAYVLLKALKPHPNILQAFGCDQFPNSEESNLYTQYCDGGDLHGQMLHYHNKMRRFPSERFVLHVFMSLAHALSYIHHGLCWNSETQQYQKEASFEAAYVHGDIKLENVFLRWSEKATRTGLPDVILGDFGTARLAHKFKGISGTEHYQAPEASLVHEMKTANPAEYKKMAKTPGIMTPASDVFSMGQVIFYLCKGEHHAVGGDPETDPVRRSIRGIVGVEIGGPRGYATQELVVAVRQCLQKEPGRRPETTEEGLLASVAIFREALEKRMMNNPRIPREMWASPPAIQLN